MLEVSILENITQNIPIFFALINIEMALNFKSTFYIFLEF